MALSADLGTEALAGALPDRALRCHPAVVSTEAVALDWVRGDAPSGGVVVAGYQVSPRGRAGWPWTLEADRGVAFSLVLRVRLPLAREGWLYTVATCALADFAGPGAEISWPDHVHRDDRLVAAVGIQADLTPRHGWAVVTVLLADAEPPRAPAVAAAVSAIEARLAAEPEQVMSDHRDRCRTLGVRLRARMLPDGEVSGRAIGTLRDGALLIETPDQRRMAILPQGLAEWHQED